MVQSPAQGSDPIAVRIFTVDERSGAPVPGVVLRFFAVLGSGDALALTTMVSDLQGFSSPKFDLSSYPAASALKVTYGGGGEALTVSIADLRNGLDQYRLAVSATHASADALRGIPSVTDPDDRDALLSPASIGLIPQLRAPHGLCDQLMPSPMIVRRFDAFQVRADICKIQTIDCPQQKANVVLGTALEYEIAWHPLGTSLGKLLNTITLAPCEQVTVVISDWMRRETASRQESSLTQQETTQHIEHERAIMESLNNDVTSKSLSAAYAFSTGISLPIKMINLTASAGGGVSGSLTNQQVATTTTSHITEHITEAASLVMSYRSSVVFQATASERRFYQTRTVRNSNRCHTLTIVYYQVNESFRVVTKYKGYRNVVLVQYPNDDFDAKRAYCNAAILRPALLDKSLDGCFDELAQALFCCNEKPQLLMDSVTITATVVANSGTSSIKFSMGTANGGVQTPAFSVTGWQSGQTVSQTIALPAPIDPATVNNVILIPSGLSGFSLSLSQLDFTYHAVGIANPLSLYSLGSPTSTTQAPLNLIHGWSDRVDTEIPPPGAGANPCVEKSCCAQKLLGHLNCNKRFYNDLLWLNEDPNERIMRWSCCSGLDLIGTIENTPIAIYGDFVVFPAGPLIPQSLPPVRNVVTLPTPGVYSEGILGQCDTCEIVDPQRYTDWKCPDVPPDPTLPGPQTGVSAGDLKPETITNQISLATIPAAPDSILKTLLDALLGSAKAGSSESTALLNKLFDLLKETLMKKASSGGGSGSGESGGG
jgi:hypothetical protein